MTWMLNLANGKSAYGKGSWASSIRFHNGTHYVSTFAQTTGKTYIYLTKDIEKGPWEVKSFRPSLHDHSLFFDDDGRVYMLYGGGNLRLVELKDDLSGLKEGGFNQVVVTNASAVAGAQYRAECGRFAITQGPRRYYLFNITRPRGGMRTVLVHRADKLTGPWKGASPWPTKAWHRAASLTRPRGMVRVSLP